MTPCIYCGKETNETVKIAEPRFTAIKKEDRAKNDPRSKKLKLSAQRIPVCSDHAGQVRRAMRDSAKKETPVKRQKVLQGQMTIEDYLL